MMSTFVISGEVTSPLNKKFSLYLLLWILSCDIDDQTKMKNYVTSIKCSWMASNITYIATYSLRVIFYLIHMSMKLGNVICLTFPDKVSCSPLIKRWFGFTDNVKCSHWKQVISPKWRYRMRPPPNESEGTSKTYLPCLSDFHKPSQHS